MGVGLRTGWIPECEARLAVAQVLTRAEGPAAAEEIGRALDRAAELVEHSGARLYQPRVHEARAELARVLGDQAERDRELREAHRLYTEMGATGHAQRLAKELRPVNCSSCGHENREGAKFCEECAASLQRSCSACGTALRPGAKFCDECAQPTATTAAGSDREPRDYTPQVTWPTRSSSRSPPWKASASR